MKNEEHIKCSFCGKNKQDTDVLIAGITPFPFKVITIMSGWTAMPFGVFVISSFVARSLRFFMVATLLYYYGASIRGFIETRLSLVFTLFVIILGLTYL